MALKKSVVLAAMLMTLPLWFAACGGSSGAPAVEETGGADGVLTVRIEMTDVGATVKPPDPRLANWRVAVASDEGQVRELATDNTGAAKFDLSNGRYNVSVRPEQGWIVIQQPAVVLDLLHQSREVKVQVSRGGGNQPPEPPDEPEEPAEPPEEPEEPGGTIEPPQPLVSVANSKTEVFGDPPSDGPNGTADGMDRIGIYVEVYGPDNKILRHADLKADSYWVCTSDRPEDVIDGGPMIELGESGSGEAIAVWEVKTTRTGTGRYTVKVTDKNGFPFTLGAVQANWLAPPPEQEPRLEVKQAAALDDWLWKYDRLEIEAGKNFYFWIGVENLNQKEVEIIVTSTGVAEVVSAGAEAKALVAVYDANGNKLRDMEKTLAQVASGVAVTLPPAGKTEIGLAGVAADHDRPQNDPKVVAIGSRVATAKGKEFATGGLEVRIYTVQPEPLVDTDKSTFKILGRAANNFDPNKARANGKDFIWVYAEACGQDGNILQSSVIAEWICKGRTEDVVTGGLATELSFPDNPNPAIGQWKVRTTTPGVAAYTVKVKDALTSEVITLGVGTATWQDP